MSNSPETWRPKVEPLPEDLPAEPFALFQQWYDHAWDERRTPNTNAMSLATIDPDGVPSNRIVLCKKIEPDPGCILFFTNYTGAKGRAIDANPAVAACFHWDVYDRQVRMAGPVTRTSEAESDEYFNSRHWTRRVGAWASDQSEPIESRDAMIEKVDSVIERLGLDVMALMASDEGGPHVDIPRPPHWGGFRIWPRSVELWSGGEGRVHDRAVWTRDVTPAGDAFACGDWTATRLQP
ncbi:MAG: pyridoxamine 5'-phosphate oxidase [Phycisphaerales bacterium]